MSRNLANPERGQLVDVTWIDIVEDPRGHPAKTKLAEFHHTYRWWGWREDKFGGKTVKFAALTSSKGVTEADESAYHAIVIPKHCIIRIEPAT